MKYVVLQTGGKQYRVSEGDILEVEQLTAEKDQKLTLNDVLLYTNDGVVKVGTPLVSGVSISAVVLDHVRGEKIRVAKFKAKARTRRVTGHRQSLTKIKIESILDGEKKTETKPAKEKMENVAEVSTKKPARVKKS